MLDFNIWALYWVLVLGKIKSHNEVAGWVRFINANCTNSVWINLLTVFLSRLEATLN